MSRNARHCRAAGKGTRDIAPSTSRRNPERVRGPRSCRGEPPIPRACLALYKRPQPQASPPSGGQNCRHFARPRTAAGDLQAATDLPAADRIARRRGATSSGADLDLARPAMSRLTSGNSNPVTEMSRPSIGRRSTSSPSSTERSWRSRRRSRFPLATAKRGTVAAPYRW